MRKLIAMTALPFPFRRLRGGAALALLSTTLLLACLLQPSPAAAQTPEQRLQELEEVVRSLQQEIADLKAAQDEPKEALSASATASATDDKLAEIERRLDLLAQELERFQLGEAAPEADEGDFGFGPAASKIYRTSRGLSIGGYGEMVYRSFDSRRDDGSPSQATDELDFLRAIVYFGYKFNDRWLFNSEIEFEHATTDVEGSVSVEFAYLDYLWKKGLNGRVGMVLLPMGLINELHEPTTFLGARRPDTESALIPSTWRENGVGIFGDLGPFSYRTYLVNGLDASGFSSAGLRGGRQKGSKASAEDFAWVGRLDYTGQPGLLAGVSAYVGDSGQGLEAADGSRLGVKTSIIEGHLDWRYRGLEARGLWARAKVGDAAALNRVLGLRGDASVGEEMSGGYVQLGYDVLSRVGTASRSLIPFLRYETLDTQSQVPAGYSRNGSRDISSWTLGLSFKPIDNLVFKADFQDYDNSAGSGLDQFNVAFGYIF